MEVPRISSLDHVVLTVTDINQTLMFYSKILGLSVTSSANGRLGLSFGSQKINLHSHGQEYIPHAGHIQPGSADICLISPDSVESKWIPHFEKLGIPIVEGPVDRTGATGPILSIYIRDPDQNLIEIANYYNN